MKTRFFYLFFLFCIAGCKLDWIGIAPCKCFRIAQESGFF